MKNMERLYREIIEGAGDAIIFSDGEGKIRLWNRGAERIFGFSKEEALGASLDIIIPEKLRERHWEGYARSMETGQTKYGDSLLGVPALRKGGERISIEFTVVMIFDDEGKPEGVAAIIRDVTERFLREKELKRRLEEAEGRERRDSYPGECSFF
ncbi:MAG: PAS domain S-box protein [Deltaproteobacteria bacterium]|nr:MAG: PAS domain S-box protein [Deltaproteobacteria bacterium]